MRRSVVWNGIKSGLIVLIPFVAMFAALFAGRYAVSFQDVVQSLIALPEVIRAFAMEGGASASSQVANDISARTGCPVEALVLVTQVRAPRVLAAAGVGAALAAAGAAYQGVFRNPLVNPGLLGVSNGAGFGAALAIVAVGGGVAVYPSAFLFGVIAVVMSYAIARVYRQTPTIMLILGGTIVSSVFSALVSLMKYVADSETQLPSIVFWLMGSLSGIGWQQLWALAPIVLGAVVLLFMAWRIDVLSMGDKEARSLGVNVGASKGVVVIGATLATAGAVCMAGVVGWIGLVVPHIGRMLVGSESRKLIPASMALGAAFLVVVDTVARCLWASEVPLGILTALIGAPFFVYLLKRTKGKNW